MKRYAIVLASALVICLATVLSLVFTQSSSAQSLPALSTPSQAYTVPGTTLVVTPQDTGLLQAQTANADATVKSYCSTVHVAGCASSVPDSIQSITFTDHHDSDAKNWITNKPAYLLNWRQTGKDCLEHLGGPPHLTTEQRSHIAENATCTYSIVVDAATNTEIDRWEG